MAGLSGAGEQVILNALLTGAKISLHTADPGNTGASEVAGFAYARQLYGAYTFAGANPSVASNDVAIDFPTATGAWGTISYFGVWTTGGTFLGGAALAVAKSVTTDDIFRFPATALTFSSDDV